MGFRRSDRGRSGGDKVGEEAEERTIAETTEEKSGKGGSVNLTIKVDRTEGEVEENLADVPGI